MVSSCCRSAKTPDGELLPHYMTTIAQTSQLSNSRTSAAAIAQVQRVHHRVVGEQAVERCWHSVPGKFGAWGRRTGCTASSAARSTSPNAIYKLWQHGGLSDSEAALSTVAAKIASRQRPVQLGDPPIRSAIVSTVSSAEQLYCVRRIRNTEPRSRDCSAPAQPLAASDRQPCRQAREILRSLRRQPVSCRPKGLTIDSMTVWYSVQRVRVTEAYSTPNRMRTFRSPYRELARSVSCASASSPIAPTILHSLVDCLTNSAIVRRPFLGVL